MALQKVDFQDRLSRLDRREIPTLQQELRAASADNAGLNKSAAREALGLPVAVVLGAAAGYVALFIIFKLFPPHLDIDLGPNAIVDMLGGDLIYGLGQTLGPLFALVALPACGYRKLGLLGVAMLCAWATYPTAATVANFMINVAHISPPDFLMAAAGWI